MEQFFGTSINQGIAIGKVCFPARREQKVQKETVSNIEEEIRRFDSAHKEAAKQLSLLYDKVKSEAGEAGAKIFEAHSVMLEDEEYNASVYNIIRDEKVNAEYAVSITANHFEAMFSGMEDEYFKARSIDVKDISDRLLRILNHEYEEAGLKEPSILAASDLTPSETVQMDKSKLLAFVTERGSSNSHTAILARTMNIPAIAGIPAREEWDGKTAIVDGGEGRLYIEPEQETLEHYRERMEKEKADREALASLKGLEDVTLSGKKINLYANIGSTADVADALLNDAAGIGLFRSEFLYLEKEFYPTEEEQFQAYKTVAQGMEGKPVIVRTLDIGADKKADYFKLEKEENPAMGYRAIRICLERQEVFKTQLRALYRASAFGNISIMFPMIISEDEIKRIKEICNEVKEELKKEGHDFKDVELGVMIETPAAVMISDLLAHEVEFFSIGTNDLTQYTLAIDRQNGKLEAFCDPHHEAILRMIQMTIENGHAGNCRVGICGELGADTTLTETFLRMGIDEISVAPAYILPIRKIIRECE